MDEQQLQQGGMEATSRRPSAEELADLEEFRITNSKVIFDILRQLMKRQDFLTVESDSGTFRISTRILAVDKDEGIFVFDSGSEQFQNVGLLEAQETFFSASQEGVKIQFVSVRPEQFEFDGGVAFWAPLPQSLYRVQRREFFRAAAPLVEEYCCIAVLPDERKVVWDIVDLSLDGLGLRSKDPGLGELPMGTLLSQVVLNFGRRGSITTNLRLTNLRNIRGPSNPVYRIGCRFEGFPKSKEQDFQRLITYLELARRGREEGAVTKDSGFY